MTETDLLEPRPSAAVGRADLIHALAEGRLGPMAEISGFVPPVQRPAMGVHEDEPSEAPARRRQSRARPETAPSPALFVQPLYCEALDPVERARAARADIQTLRARVAARAGSRDQTAREWSEPSRALEAGEFEALLPALRRAIAGPRPIDAPDIPRLVARLSRGESPRRVPRLERRRWGADLRVLVDGSTRLAPFQGEHLDLLGRLKTLFPRGGVASSRCDGPDDIIADKTAGVVVAVTDLGLFAPAVSDGVSPTILAWRRAGDRLRAAGRRPVAILPAAPPEGFAGLDEVWTIIARGPPSPHHSERDRADALSRLITIAAPAITLQPGLLRDLRRLVVLHPDHRGPPPRAWLDSVFWTSSYLATNPFAAAGADPNRRREALERFADLPSDLRTRALATIRAWRPPGALLWAEEMLALDPVSRKLIDEADLEAAAEAWVGLAEAVEAEDLSGVEQDAFFRRARKRIPPAVLLEPAEDGPLWQKVFREANTRLETVVNPGGGKAPTIDSEGEDGSKQAATAPPPPARRVFIRQEGDRIAVGENDYGTGSPIAFIDTGDDAPSVETLPPFWRAGAPPPWADAWGCDRHGPWVDFSVRPKRGDPVVQRMRWIPEGAFQMGSPPDEPDRGDWEGPRHLVTLPHGFWMFDTPVTQALWLAVMGGRNPSRFKSPDRPVESVSWTDARAFIDKINAPIPGLALDLPSEARWEHACRAGADTALYTGPIDILGECNAPALDPIAWYGGNSGVDFELSNGADSDGWPDKQYPHTRAGSHPVARKAPNAWGLHDMLGNVWEWCEDHWHRNYEGAPTDGSAWLDPNENGAGRVLRGGSWNDYARDCRSAYRLSFDPDFRFNFIGFRCARVQSGAEPGGARRIRPAERRIAASLSGGAGARRLIVGGPEARAPLPPGAPFVIRSDREHLTFGLVERPAWASAMGRDRFGLWSEIRLDNQAWPAVKQRLRWIPPGRFMMGSPEDEPGRYDDEGPQHQVTIANGSWLFDTPCTQALWEGVMGENPSEFNSPRRPVDSVSWNDVQGFIAKLNERIPGLSLTLPTEAAWEYACRAGTTTALYNGPIEILGENNAPALDAIAWYGGNSGNGFELDNGYDSSDWSEKQYPHTKAGTHPVAMRTPNAWGLYDMIGNVWEWCEDHWHGDYKGSPSDGTAWIDEDVKSGAERVLRGGSWSDDAGDCRSASRSSLDPDGRFNDIGFRCARVQA